MPVCVTKAGGTVSVGAHKRLITHVCVCTHKLVAVRPRVTQKRARAVVRRVPTSTESHIHGCAPHPPELCGLDARSVCEPLDPQETPPGA